MEPFQHHHHLLINRTGATRQTSFCFTLNSQIGPELFWSPQADPPMCTDALVTVMSPFPPHATYFQGLSPFTPPYQSSFQAIGPQVWPATYIALIYPVLLIRIKNIPNTDKVSPATQTTSAHPLVSHSFIHSFTQKDCASTMVPARPCVLAMEQMKKKKT